MAIRIIFVDDDTNVLSGLRRTLRSWQPEWDVVYVESGKAALTAIEHAPADIVVADLQMPDMDGFELLKRVRNHAPETVRIALSGHADRMAPLRGTGPIHQFLSKPCNSDVLKSTLLRAVSLRQFLSDPRLRQTVAQMEALPSLPHLLDQVTEELSSPTSSLGDIGDIIAHDAGMSTKVLQLVNSAFFGVHQRIGSPAQAVVVLGLDAIKVLVLSIRLFDQFSECDLAGLNLSDVWEHSVTVARVAKRLTLAEAPDENAAECAFLSGLLHDTGKLVLAANMPEKYRSVVRLAGNRANVFPTVERNVLGASHGEVGAYLMGLWGFPYEVVEAILLHHSPERTEQKIFNPLTAVHAANALVLANECDGIALPSATLNLEYLTQIGMVERIPLWEQMVSQSLGEGDRQ